MNEQAQQAKFEGWALVEMMGHQREVGYVTTEVFGAACLFRVDTPELPEREYELKHPEWVVLDGGTTKYAPVGAKVRRPAVPAKSRLVGPPAIYAITPCTEETARRAIEELIRRPVILLHLPPEQPELTAAQEEERDENWRCAECGEGIAGCDCEDEATDADARRCPECNETSEACTC